VTNAKVRGLAALQNRFAGALDERAVKEALPDEAEALAAGARLELARPRPRTGIA
jgi:hypothetical protein